MSKTTSNGAAQTRLASLFDDGIFVEIDAQNSSGAKAGYGSIGGTTAFAFCQDSDAIDRAQTRKLSKVYELAAKTGAPVAVIYDSKGVGLADGFAAMESASEILRRMSELSGVVPQIAVVLGSCGGFSALAAASADFCVMSKKAEIFLTSAFTDKAAGGNTAGVGSAAYAQKAGIAAVVCEDEVSALTTAAKIIGLLPLNNLAALPVHDFAEPAFVTDKCPLYTVCDDGAAIELFEEMGRASRTALTTIGGMPCGFIGVRGEPCREDTAKCARLVEICDAFNLPIVNFVHSGGFWTSADSDLHGGIRNAARLAHVLAEATAPKVTVVTGEAIGSVYSVFCGKNAGCDMSYAWNGAVISPLAPEAMAALLWEDRVKQSGDIATLGAEYAATEASAQKAAEAGAVDAVIEPAATRQTLIAALDMLASKRVSRLPKKHGNMPL